jgi:hypothetical protein
MQTRRDPGGPSEGTRKNRLLDAVALAPIKYPGGPEITLKAEVMKRL